MSMASIWCGYGHVYVCMNIVPLDGDGDGAL